MIKVTLVSPLNLLCKSSRIPDGAFLFGRTYIRRLGAVGVDEWKKQEVGSSAQNQLLDGLTQTLLSSPNLVYALLVGVVLACKEVKAGNILEPTSDSQNL